MDKLSYVNRNEYRAGDPSLVSRNAERPPKGDMHMHTTYSDGTFTPEAVVRKAAEHSLAAVAITDHDSVHGVTEAIETGRAIGIDVIPGIELSAMTGGQEVHILGFFIDYRDEKLLEYLRFFRAERVKRAREMVKRLNELDIPVTLDTILENAEIKSIGRPHVAAAVLETGHVKTYLEVFHKYIGFGCPAYVEKHRLDVKDAIQLITRAGGLSFIAHPNDSIRDTVLFDIIKAGIDGIETVHPSISKSKTAYYRGITQEYFLLESGGSDFHGNRPVDEENIGRYGVPVECIDAMRKRLVA
jgi:3',5'-nucleoside bisphosphate phosphatase